MSNDLSEKDQKAIQILVPIIFVVIFGILFYLRLNHIIPGPDKIVEFLRHLYTQYGYIVVLIAAILEGLIVVNSYAPGSTAILLGVVFARQSNLSVPGIIALAVVGFLISYSVNYLLGRYALKNFLHKAGYSDQIKGVANALERKGPWYILSSYFHPNMAAIVSTGAGVAHMPFPIFFISSAIALIFWDSLWGVAAYHLGESALKLSESPWAYLVIMFWVGLSYYITQRVAKKNT
jgi:membrane protein DedA with SNARE-associated domain